LQFKSRYRRLEWSGRMDLNHRPPGPEPQKNKSKLLDQLGLLCADPLANCATICDTPKQHYRAERRISRPYTLGQYLLMDYMPRKTKQIH